MARALNISEIDDPDLDWLVSTFLSKNPHYLPFECGNLPLVLFPVLQAKPALIYEAPKDLPAPLSNRLRNKTKGQTKLSE